MTGLPMAGIGAHSRAQHLLVVLVSHLPLGETGKLFKSSRVSSWAGMTCMQSCCNVFSGAVTEWQAKELLGSDEVDGLEG